LRGNLPLAGLADQNLEWVVGRNPFVESLMWGEGYDYAPQYSAMSGDIVGSLPVGIQTHRNADAPYWPTENCHNWKEVWVHPTGRWIWILRDLAGAPLVEGVAARGQSLQFREMSTGRTTSIACGANGRFRESLPEGEYEILGDPQATSPLRTTALLPGGSYFLDLTPEHNVDLKVVQETNPNGSVTLRATVSGNGEHSFSARVDNLEMEQPEQTVMLKAGTPQTIVWRAQVVRRDAPWIAVVIPDKDLTQKKELTGSLSGR
jgi:hypothetical protein